MLFVSCQFVVFAIDFRSFWKFCDLRILLFSLSHPDFVFVFENDSEKTLRRRWKDDETLLEGGRSYKCKSCYSLFLWVFTLESFFFSWSQNIHFICEMKSKSNIRLLTLCSNLRPPICQYMIYHLTDWAFYTSRLSIYELPSYWLSFLYLPSVNIFLRTELSIPPVCQYILTDWAFYTSRLSIYSYWLSFLYLPSVNIMIYHLTDWAFYTSRLSIYDLPFYWLSFLYLQSVNIFLLTELSIPPVCQYILTDWAFYTPSLSIYS